MDNRPYSGSAEYRKKLRNDFLRKKAREKRETREAEREKLNSEKKEIKDTKPYSGSIEERRKLKLAYLAKKARERRAEKREKQEAERKKLKDLLGGLPKWPKFPPE